MKVLSQRLQWEMLKVNLFSSNMQCRRLCLMFRVERLEALPLF